MNIIEKLGITPGPWVARNVTAELKLSTIEAIDGSNGYGCFVIESENMFLLLAAPEMLEALIEDCIEDEVFYQSKGFSTIEMIAGKYGSDGEAEIKSFKRKIAVIEKSHRTHVVRNQAANQ